MKSYSFYFLIVISSAVVLLFSTCKKDDNPDDNEYQDPWTLVQEEYIGSSGGVIDTNGIRFEIPAGAFGASQKISLYICEENTFGSNQASAVYEIRGLPEDFEAVIPVTLKTNQTLQDEFYLAAGVLDYAKSMRDTVYSTTYFPAEDSSGYLVSAIIVYGSKHQTGAVREGGPGYEFLPQGKVIVHAESNFDHYSTINGHFRVDFTRPDVTLAQASQLGEALEAAWQKFKDMNFDYEKLTDKYPIPVTYRAFKESWIPLVGDNPKDWGAYTPGLTSFTPSFEFNSAKLLVDAKKVAPTAGHECFHMVQSLYNTHGELKNWMTEATATYCEELFSADGPNYFPDEFGSQWYHPLVGMQAGTYFADPNQASNSSYHGYGMSVIIKYLINNATVPNPLKVMIESLHNDMHPVDAAFSVMPGANIASVWQMAMLNYISKTTYPKLSQRNFIAGDLYYTLNWAKMITLKASETAFPSASYVLPDLSATFTRLTLEGNFSPEQELDINLEVAGEASDFNLNTYYFVYKNSGETPLSNSPTAGTTKLKSLKENNNSIAVLVMNTRHVNPYTDMTHVTVEFRIKGKPVVKTNAADGVSSTSAVVNGEVNASGYPTVVLFEYGLTNSYGSTVSVSQSPVEGYLPVQVSANLGGLDANKTYHYRISATNQGGTSVGQDATFKTSGNGGAPIAVTLAATNVGPCSATLNGTINPGGASAWAEFEYGLTTAYGNNWPLNTEYTGDQPVTVNLNLSKNYLTPNQTYHYRINAYRLGFTDVSYGADMTFTLTGAIEVGQQFQGGIVFYVDESCSHGLIAAAEDLGLTDWGCSGIYIGATASGTGEGIANTAAIVAGCTTENIAAALCNDIALGGYTDWYLPSISELSVLINSKDIVGGFNSGTIYWSSTEIDANNAYGVSVDDPMNWGPLFKNTMRAVRPIRAF